VIFERVLITGGAGLVGSHIADALIAHAGPT
jgi:nucleoside-diphosphate-sugar epimerase